MEKLELHRIAAGSIYKLVFTGLLFGLLPLCVLFGIMALFGMSTVTWNDQPVTGPSALVVSPLIGVFLSLLFTAILGSVIALGLWVFSKFRPMNIYVFPATNRSSE